MAADEGEEPKGRKIDYTMPLLLNTIIVGDKGIVGEGMVIIEWKSIVRVQEFMFPNLIPEDRRNKAVIVLPDAMIVALVNWNWLGNAWTGYLTWKKNNITFNYSSKN